MEIDVPATQRNTTQGRKEKQRDNGVTKQAPREDRSNVVDGHNNPHQQT